MYKKVPLTAAMDNVLAWKLCDAFRVAQDAPAGDPIDRGLALLRGLNDAGFDVVVRDQGMANLFPGQHVEREENIV